jgi:GAF domain-containing protein
VPLILRGQVVGSIVLEREGGDGWTPEERELATSIGVQACLSLENARLLNESQSRARRERLVGDITARMRETLDMDVILQTALREIGDKLRIAQIEVRLQDDGRGSGVPHMGGAEPGPNGGV